MMAGEIEKGGAAEKAEPTPLESYRDKAKKWAIGLLVASIALSVTALVCTEGVREYPNDDDYRAVGRYSYDPDTDSLGPYGEDGEFDSDIYEEATDNMNSSNASMTVAASLATNASTVCDAAAGLALVMWAGSNMLVAYRRS